jgi:hypothetical protein
VSHYAERVCDESLRSCIRNKSSTSEFTGSANAEMTHYAWTLRVHDRHEIQKVTTLAEMQDTLITQGLPGIAPPGWFVNNEWDDNIPRHGHYTHHERKDEWSLIWTKIDYGPRAAFRWRKNVMSAYSQSLDDSAAAMMGQLLVNECARRGITPQSAQGEEIALLILHAFRGGMTDESELAAFVTHLPEC